MVTTNCTTGSIAPYIPSAEAPWDRRRIQHLYSRLGYGANTDQIDQAMLKLPSQLVNELVEAALNADPIAAPPWAYWTRDDYAEDQEDFFVQQAEFRVSFGNDWIQDMLSNPLRAKMTFFWHNHFVTQIDKYLITSWMYQYYRVLEQHAFGNFKAFVSEIGKNEAMLVYLDGVLNAYNPLEPDNPPNENYARELFELFTLGENNGYTQQDITEAAKALTGYNGYTDLGGPINFVPALHNPRRKTIFGQEDFWGYQDVVDLLFSERGDLVAEYICSKLYRYFVSPTIDEDIVSEMCATFKQNDFEIAPVLRQLFLSEHFFDDAVIGNVIKSPFELLVGFMSQMQLGFSEEIGTQILYLCSQLKQTVFSPPNVAGWPGDRVWIDSTTLTTRWQVLRFYIFYVYDDTPDTYRVFGKKLAGTIQNDPDHISRQIVDFFIPTGLQSDDDYEKATIVFKANIPQNYFDDMSWNLDWDEASAQVGLLIDHIIRLPEFQMS